MRIRTFACAIWSASFAIAAAYATTPLAIGTIKSKVPGISDAGLADLVLTSLAMQTGETAFAKCPMVLVVSGRDRAAVDAERAIQQGPEFDPSTRVTGRPIDPQYLIDGEVTVMGDAVNWTLRANDAKSKKTLAEGQFTGTVSGLFEDSEGAARALLTAACEKLTRKPRPLTAPLGGGTITMTARFDYKGSRTRDSKTTKEVLTFALDGLFVLQLTANKIYASANDDGSTDYFVSGPLTSSRISRWRLGHLRTSKDMVGNLVTLGSAIGSKDEAESLFIITVKDIAGRKAVSVRPPSWFAANGDPKGRETATNENVFCCRTPEHREETREVEGPTLQAKDTLSPLVEGILGGGPGLKGVVVSDTRYVIYPRWSTYEFAPEAPPVEVRIEFDLRPK